MKNELTVNLNNNDGDGKAFPPAATLTILEGQALEQRAPQKIMITGDIKAVSNFIKTRKEVGGDGLQAINPKTAIVIVDKFNQSIKLNLDPENVYGAEVTAVLSGSEELANFHINKVKTFTKEELVKLIKFNRLFFADFNKHTDLLFALQKLSSQVNINADSGGDDRGNKIKNFTKNVTTNVPMEFILNIPVFKGFPPVTFRVEICLDVTEGGARFWLESTELAEIIVGQVNGIFEEELKAAEGLVIINV